LPLLLPLVLTLAALTEPATATDLVVREVTVISPELEAPRTHVDVLIRDGRMLARMRFKSMGAGYS